MTDEAAARPNPVRRLYDWVLSLAERPHAGWWLGGISFAEASFFPIPPDVMLIPLCLGSVSRAMRFAVICSVASILGGMFGYTIGWTLWESMSSFFFDWIPGFTPEKFDKMDDIYDEWGVLAVFTAGFTPIPFKIFTISSGVFGLNFLGFLVASAIGRSARFFLVAWLLARYGTPMKRLIDKYFNLCAFAFCVLLVGGFLIIKLVLH